MNYLPVSVYGVQSDNTFMCGDSSNCGVTLIHRDKLVVPCATGHITEDDVAKRGYVVLEPMEPSFPGCPLRFKPRGQTGGMAGGRFVYTSDSRFRETYGWHPISVHDRVE